MRAARSYFLAVLLSTSAALAGVVNLVEDEDFGLFPQACELGTDTGCWFFVGDWESAPTGNDGFLGSGAPSAQCNAPTIPDEMEMLRQPRGNENELDPVCTIAQCVDISAVPANTLILYGFNYFLLEPPPVITVTATAYDNATCSSAPAGLRSEIDADTLPLDNWISASENLSSQPGDMSILISFSAAFGEEGMGEGKQPELRVDDGFLAFGIPGEVSPLEIPTAIG